MRSNRSAHRWQRLWSVVVAVLLVGAAFSGTEGLALASSSPGDQQIKAAGAAAAQAQGRTALSCPAAVAGRKAHRHFFTLAEALECAPGAAISADGRFSLRILPMAGVIGYSKTVIVEDHPGQYEIRKVSVEGDGTGQRTVSAAGCPEVSTWNEGQWFLDTYINNQTRWQRNWSYCSGGPYAHIVYVSGTCQAFFPYVCISIAAYRFEDYTRDAYTEVQNLYTICQILCLGSYSKSAWQEMTWDTRGWWDYYAWFN